LAIFTILKNSQKVYYSLQSCELQPLLHSRPIEFHLWMNDDDVFYEKLDNIVNEVMQANEIFRYQTRKKLLIIPERNILYAQSNLKNVEIYKADGTTESVFAKLVDIESKLSCRFVRIHQSFMVNMDYIRCIEKDTHMAVIEGGERIPISETRYQMTMLKLKNLNMIQD